MTNAQSHIRTDEAQDVAGSVRHVLRCWDLATDDPHVWKWIILALHSALQGACVCHLVTSASPLGVVTKRNTKEWLEYFEESRTNPSLKQPKTVMMNLPELLKAVRKENSAGRPGAGGKVKVSEPELQILTHLHENLRNQFTHFEPQGWSIEVSGMAKISHLIARIINEIFDCGSAFMHLSPKKQDLLQVDLKALSEVQQPPNSNCENEDDDSTLSDWFSSLK